MGTWNTNDKPVLTTISLSQTEAFRAIGAGAKPLWSTDTIEVPATNATYWAADVDSPTNVTYNLPLAGGGTQSLIATPDELSSTGIYDRSELRYNKSDNQWTLVPIEKRRSSAAIPASFNSLVKFDADYYMVNHILAGDTTFSADMSGAVPGGGTLMYLKGNGTSTVSFSAELNKAGGSLFNNTLNFVNQIVFFFNGSIYTYTITPIGFAVTSDGKVAQYDFEQSGDYTDNVLGKTLARNNVTSVAGKHGSGVQFSGSPGSYLSGEAGLYNFIGPFSFAFWLKPNTLYANMSVFNHYLFESIACYIDSVNSALGFTIQPETGSSSAADEIKPTGTLSVGTWTHFAITYDGSNMKMYVNSILLATKPHTPPKATTYGFLIGDFGPFNALSAVIDDFYVYSKAISQSEVNAIYAS